MKRRKVNFELIKTNDTHRFGRATIVSLTSTTGIKAYGIATKSNEDKENPDVGYNIARSRAETSLSLKLSNKKVKHRFMW